MDRTGGDRGPVGGFADSSEIPESIRSADVLPLLGPRADGARLESDRRYTGYAAFGNVAFFGLGAYTTGLLMLSKLQVPFFPALFCGALLAGLIAALIGLPVLRLKGHDVAIATLGGSEALRQVADTWGSVIQGSTGIDLPVRTHGAFFYDSALAFVVV